MHQLAQRRAAPRAANAPGEREDARPWMPVALAIITLAGLLLRLELARDSVFGDELFTHAIATESSLGAVFDGINTTENTPPLYYLAAWLSAKVGDPTYTIRVPSIVLGTATIPLVYAIGAELRGRVAGLLAALVIALSPFSIFYGSEARAYAALGFCVAVATWALLRAIRSASARWWVLWVIATALGLYLHYIAVLPTAAQVAWVVLAHPAARRRALVAAAAAAIAYLPWVPWLGQNASLDAIGQSYPLTVANILKGLRAAFPGHPFVEPSQTPGTVGLVAFVVLAVLLVAGAAAVRRSSGSFPTLSSDRSATLLLATMAVASPLGLIAYSVVSGTSLYLPRNLLPSLVPFSVLLALAVTAMPPKIRAAAAAALAIGLSAGVVTTLDRDNRRPALREVASVVDAEANRGDRLVDMPLFLSKDRPLQRALAVHLERDHPTFGLVGIRRSGAVVEALTDERAWSTRDDAPRVFVTGYESPGRYLTPRPPSGSRYRLESRRVFRGWVPLTLTVYVAEESGG